MGVYIPNMEKPKHCGMCEFQDMCACILLREPIPINHNILPDCPLIEIVRCEECKWLGVDDGMPFCYWWLREIEPDVFCSYGERRSDESNTERD